MCGGRSFSAANAAVACRQLGFVADAPGGGGTAAVALALDGAAFGPGTGPITMAGVACSGDERFLSACRSVRSRVGMGVCGGGKVAGYGDPENARCCMDVGVAFD